MSIYLLKSEITFDSTSYIFMIDPPHLTKTPPIRTIFNDYATPLEPVDVWKKLLERPKCYWIYLTGHTKEEIVAIIDAMKDKVMQIHKVK